MRIVYIRDVSFLLLSQDLIIFLLRLTSVGANVSRNANAKRGCVQNALDLRLKLKCANDLRDIFSSFSPRIKLNLLLKLKCRMT